MYLKWDDCYNVMEPAEQKAKQYSATWAPEAKSVVFRTTLLQVVIRASCISVVGLFS